MHAVWNRITESGIWNLEIFFVESRILGFEIWNTPRGIQIPLTIRSSTVIKESEIQYLEPVSQKSR